MDKKRESLIILREWKNSEEMCNSSIQLGTSCLKMEETGEKVKKQYQKIKSNRNVLRIVASKATSDVVMRWRIILNEKALEKESRERIYILKIV